MRGARTAPASDDIKGTVIGLREALGSVEHAVSLAAESLLDGVQDQEQDQDQKQLTLAFAPPAELAVSLCSHPSYSNWMFSLTQCHLLIHSRNNVI